jgi:K+-transporting ATPase ATPase C chain
MIRNFVISLRNTALLWILTALIYPAIVLVIGQLVFPYQANGSLITNSQGQVVGSALIGQTFTEEGYFWSRPSAINYSEGANASPTGISGASNLAPSNPDLLSRIEAEVQHLEDNAVQPTADLLYSSGSGLDPHISLAAAQAQFDRVAKARSISPQELQSLITEHTEGRFLGIFGEPGVNVLTLNLALDNR